MEFTTAWSSFQCMEDWLHLAAATFCEADSHRRRSVWTYIEFGMEVAAPLQELRLRLVLHELYLKLVLHITNCQ